MGGPPSRCEWHVGLAGGGGTHRAAVWGLVAAHGSRPWPPSTPWVSAAVGLLASLRCSLGIFGWVVSFPSSTFKKSLCCPAARLSPAGGHSTRLSMVRGPLCSRVVHLVFPEHFGSGGSHSRYFPAPPHPHPRSLPLQVLECTCVGRWVCPQLTGTSCCFLRLSAFFSGFVAVSCHVPTGGQWPGLGLLSPPCLW